ncbi:MAG: hypothetical protein ACLPSW_00215 [Roseiarcus sp.]
MSRQKHGWEKAADIVTAAGGQIVGRTKLQKIAYLLELCGMGDGFEFDYRHYGPYSEDLSDAIKVAGAFGLISEEERRAAWGGTYSVYSSQQQDRGDGQRATFARTAAAVGAIELELAATAAYLSSAEHCADPWGETKRRKPEKATDERLRAAKKAYALLQSLPAPRPLPQI